MSVFITLPFYYAFTPAAVLEGQLREPRTLR